MAKPLDQLSRAELDELGFGRHGVEDIEHSWFTLPGGERLALRIWAPSGTIQDEVGVRTMNMMVPRNFDLLKRHVTTGCPISPSTLCFCHFLRFWSTYRLLTFIQQPWKFAT